MTIATCRSCGAQINYGPKHAGRAVKCPKCSEPILLPAIEPEIEPEIDAADQAYGVAPPDRVPSSEPGRTPSELVNTGSRPVQTMPGRLREERVKRGFWADARLSFTFLSKLDNAMVIIMYAVIMTVGAGASILPGIIGLIVTVFFFGLLFAFYFDIVQTTASGEDDLPSLMEWEGFLDSAVIPVVKFVGTIAIAMFPAMIARFMFGIEMSRTEEIIFTVIMMLGWFFWPVIVLAVSTLGYGLVFRVDLLLRTPFVAFGAYLAICALLVVALAFEWLGSSAFLNDTFHQMMDAMNIGPGSMLGVVFKVFELFVLNALAISSTAISMRLIGLYYRHYSQRFPWSAG